MQLLQSQEEKGPFSYGGPKDNLKIQGKCGIQGSHILMPVLWPCPMRRPRHATNGLVKVCQATLRRTTVLSKIALTCQISEKDLAKTYGTAGYV